MKKYICVLLIIVIVSGVMIFLVRPNNIETFNLMEDFPLEEKLNKLDLFGKNKLKLTEYELNQLVVPVIYDELDKPDLKEKNISIDNLYIDCNEEELCIQLSVKIWKIKIGINAYGIVTAEEGKLELIISKFKIGKIKIGNNVIKKILGIDSGDFTVNLDHEIFEAININSVLINEEGIEIHFTTNNKKAIEQLVEPSERKFAKEVLYILQKDDESKEFGNKLIKVLIKKRLEIEISQEEMFEVIEKFSKIDNKQKLRIIFALSKLDIDLEELIKN